MKNAVLIIIGIIVGFLICKFFFCKQHIDDYTKNWDPSSYKQYPCDSFFNVFKDRVADPKSRFAGLKTQKADIDTLISSINTTGDVYIALVLDESMNKILLAAGAPNPPSGDWNSKPRSNPNGRPGDINASKDTIWFMMPDGADTPAKLGYMIRKENHWLSYNASDNTPANIFVNKMLKTVLPGREVIAGPVQGCPKNCPNVIAAELTIPD